MKCILKEENLIKRIMCASKAYKENDMVTSLTHDQMFKIICDLVKENDKLEKNIVDIKNYIEFLENTNKILGEEIVVS